MPQPDGTHETVKRAVKTLRGGASEADRDEFVHEAEVGEDGCLLSQQLAGDYR